MSTQWPAARTTGLWRPALSLWQRDMVRFFRQRHRVIGSLLTPIVFWLLLGGGLHHSFSLQTGDATGVGTSSASMSYLEYFFPGAVSMMLLFTAIFSTITVIEDRKEGFMQSVLASPAPRLSIVLGKVLGGASIASLQGLVMLVLWPVVGAWPGMGAMLVLVGVMFVFAMGLTALGFCIAWPLDSTSGFHAIMNLFLMPMWLLSGAAFPMQGASGVMQVVMWANPMTYGQAAVSALLTGSPAGQGVPISLGWAVVLMSLFTVLTLLWATRIVMRPRVDGT